MHGGSSLSHCKGRRQGRPAVSDQQPAGEVVLGGARPRTRPASSLPRPQAGKSHISSLHSAQPFTPLLIPGFDSLFSLSVCTLFSPFPPFSHLLGNCLIEKSL